MSNVVNTAMQYIGVPYVWGGSTPSGFDCSGLVQYSYKENGITIPRTAQEQYNQSTKIKYEDIKAGDLIFIGDSDSDINHVVMYTGNGEYIEAPHSGANVRTGSIYNLKNIVGYGTYGASGTTENTEDKGWLESKADSVLASIVKAVSVLLIAGLGFYLFCQAFDIKIM